MESLAQLIKQNEHAILNDWLQRQQETIASRRGLIKEEQIKLQATEFLNLFASAFASGEADSPKWKPVHEFLSELSRTRAIQGFSPTETATFVFSLKQPLFQMLRQNRTDAASLADDIWKVTAVVDRLGMQTVEAFIKLREEMISRQQQEMLELSTPVVRLWDGVLALPLIGTLDSARTQVVMESLLQRIVETGSAIAILDITGVPTVDTLVAQHLLKTVAAARLMGADCIISGIRPQIAQTIVHLGVDLNSVTTKATLADAFAVALKRLKLKIQIEQGPQTSQQPRAGERE
jgi:rsbT co-antagonist protein RsbR